MKKTLLALLLLVASVNISAQQFSYEYWFAAPHMCEHSQNGGYHLVLFSYDKEAHIEVSMPANPNFATISVDLNRYDYTDIQMATDYIDATNNFEVPFDVVSQRGLLIRSNNKIGAYYHHIGANAEVFSLKGQSALGTEFWVPNQNIFLITATPSYYNDAYASVQIVATENNTTIIISPQQNHNISPICNSSNVVVNLNRGETYSFRSCQKSPLLNTNGTKITSNHPIAVTSTDDSTQPGTDGLDAIGDQIVPLDYVGTEYIILGGAKPWSKCFISSIEDNNHVTLSDGTAFYLDKDSTKSISTYNISSLYISATKPVVVFQVCGNEDEPGGTMTPSLQCTGSNRVVYKRINQSLASYVDVILRTKYTNAFTINGTSISSSCFAAVQGTNEEWSFAKIEITQYEDSLFTFNCSNGLFQLAITDLAGTPGDTVSSSYGYFSDYGTSHEYDEYGYLSKGGKYTWMNHTTKTGQPMILSSIGVYTDTLQDQNGCDSICVLHLSEIPYPDNVDTVDCVVPPMASNFEMKELYSSSEINCMSTPLVADMDGDGNAEILAANWTNKMGSWSLISPYHSDGYCIFDGQTGKLIRTISIENMFSCYGQSVAIADVNKDGKSELFQQCYNNRLYCYSYDGVKKWSSPNQADNRYIPQIADIDNDGNAEIVLGKYIYDAITGTLLHTISMVETGMGWAAPHGTPDAVAYKGYYMPAVADIDGDGTLELCAGNTVYKIEITNHSNSQGNSSKILCQSQQNSDIVNYDGATVIVDFDSDGDLDVCVMGVPHKLSNSGNPIDIYVWDGQTSDIIAHKHFYASGDMGVSIPFIGDLDGDNLAEIIVNLGSMGMKVLSFNQTKDGNMNVIDGPFKETCGFTVFDFNMDGKSEIVYRDMTQLFIVDGVTFKNLSSPITAYSGTIAEYPIVADVNKDGQAEIIVNRGYKAWSNSSYSSKGWVSVYGAAQPGTWSSARSVWNQWAYNSVNINDDMTVPQYQYDIATQFPNGTKPYNSFLAQKPIIDKQGNIFVPAADAAVTASSYEVKNDSIEITLSYCNTGDANLLAPYEITIYQNKYRGTILQVDTIKDGLAVNDCNTITLKVPALSICQVARDSVLIVAINDDGHGIAQHGNQQAECDTTNNIAKIVLSGKILRDTTYVEQTICENELPYTYEPTGTTFSTGIIGQVDSVVHLLDKHGCDSLVKIQLIVLPEPHVVARGDTTIHMGDSVRLWATGADYYRWESIERISQSFEHEYFAHPSKSAVFYVYGYNRDKTGSNNLTINGNFEQGNTGFTSKLNYIAPFAILTDTETKWGSYTIAENPQAFWSYATTTATAYDGAGNMMIIDGSPIPNSVIWEQTVSVNPASYYALSIQEMSCLNSNMYSQYALLQFTINNQPIGEIFHSPQILYQWQQFNDIWYSGANTSATLRILNQNGNGYGNDFALDDIRFEPLNKECVSIDSVLILVMKDSQETNYRCTGDFPYQWNSLTITDYGQYTDTIISTSRYRDSVITLDVIEIYHTDSIENPTICSGETYTWHGKTYTSTISITDTLVNAVGCDSICTLNLIELHPTDSIENAIICDGDSYTWHGKIYTTTTIDKDTLINTVGCDSICTLNLLVINDTIHKRETKNMCDTLLPYIWHTYRDIPLSQDGMYLDTLRNNRNCDSIIYHMNLSTYHCCATLKAEMQLGNICANASTLDLSVNLISGEMNEYEVHFINPIANKMPFRDTTIHMSTQFASANPVKLNISVPHSADATQYPRPDDTYQLKLTIRDSCGNTQTWDYSPFSVYYPSWVIEQHWDDVIAVVNERYNGGYVFSKIEWLRDGDLLLGEDNPYIYLPHELWTNPEHQNQSYLYQARLTRTDDGKAILTCPIEPWHIDRTNVLGESYVDVTPTLVPKENPIVHIMTNTQGTYWLYSATGVLLQAADYEPCEHNVFDIELEYNVQTMYILVFTPP